MLQKVSCHAGRCWEIPKRRTFFEGLFDEENIVDQIEKELWKTQY